MLHRADINDITSGKIGAAAISLFGGLLALAFVCVTPAVLNDGDTYWHIAAGSWMLDHRALLRFDPFSYTFSGKPWQAHEWLSEILMALAWRVSGWNGIVLLSAVAFAATAVLLLRYLGRFLSAPAQCVVAVLSLSCGSGTLLARPHLLALPLLAFWTIALLSARDELRAPSIWLTPLIALWANLHDSYLLGLALIVVLGLEAIFEAGDDRPGAFRKWAVFAAASSVMALVTPFGINGVLLPLRLMAMPSLAFIGEWQPMNFSGVQPLEACIAALAYVWLTRGIKISVIRIAVLAFLLYLAIAHVRHGMVAGIVGALVLAKPLGVESGRLNEPNASVQPSILQRSRAMTNGSAVPISIALLVLALVSGIRLSVPIERSDGLSTPISAINHIAPRLREAPVLNDYAFGGFLIFAGIKPFIDSRAELYGDSFLSEYARIIRSNSVALAETLTGRNIAWTIFTPKSPAARELDRLGWHRIYADRWAVVHVRPDYLAASARQDGLVAGR